MNSNLTNIGLNKPKVGGKKILFLIITFLSSTFLTSNAFSAGFDSLSFKPVNDQGYYLTVEQSKTLGLLGHAFGFTGDYSDNSLVLKDGNGNKMQDVIQKQVGLNLGVAMGLTPWLDVGGSVGGVAYQQFVTPGTQVQDNGASIGDISVNLKAQLINSETSPIGLAVVPFISFPTGDQSHFTGDANVTGGGKLVLDTKRINDRFSFSLNAGGLARKDVALSPGALVVRDQFLYGGAFNAEIVKPVQVIAEARGSTAINDLFAQKNHNLELDGALRLLPDTKQNMMITLGGGVGLVQAAGVPDYRLFTTVALRFPKTAPEVETVFVPVPVETPAPAHIKEEVISTKEIHFAFNKAVIDPASYQALDKILSDIQNRPEIESVRVEGHTDSVGSDIYNQKLSEDRANAVRVFFIKEGYPSDKIHSVGMGETAPIDDNTSVAGRSQNRRVEFHLQLPRDSNVKVKKGDQPSPTFEERSSR